MPEPTPRLEEIDTNFKNAAVGDTSREWIDAFDGRLALRGLGWLEENRGAKSFRRLPDRAAGKMSQGVQALSWCPASAFVSFITDSPSVTVRLLNDNCTTMRHMPSSGSAGAELFLREGNRWLSLAMAIPDQGSPEFERELVKELPKSMREFRLYLPLYMQLRALSIGLERGAVVKPAPAEAGTKPLFIYGTSITQGGCASTAGSDFVSILGRTLETEVINFGFSGNGKGEPEVAELIAEIDAEMFVLDYAANCEPERLAGTLPEFVRILRARHPKTPIVLVGVPCYNSVLWSREAWKTQGGRRDAMIDFYIRTKQAGDDNLHYIDGFGLLGPGATGDYCDGVHPTSAGFVQMAERLAPHLTAIRVWSRNEAARGA